jgi:hypothetical protein
MYTCPDCEAEINQATEICPRCGADLAQLAQTALAAEPVKKRSLPRLLLIWAAVIAVIAAGLYAFEWYVLPEYSATGAPQQAEAATVDALRVVQSQLSLFTSAEGHYPESLEPLGAQAKAAAQAASRGGYTLQYTPGAPEKDGAVHAYTLTARAGRYGLLSFYTDQTGAIHKTRENRDAAPQDPVL